MNAQRKCPASLHTVTALANLARWLIAQGLAGTDAVPQAARILGLAEMSGIDEFIRAARAKI